MSLVKKISRFVGSLPAPTTPTKTPATSPTNTATPAAASTSIPPSEQKELLDIINTARSKTATPAANMRQVTYNPELQAAIDHFVATNSDGGYWFNIPGNKFYLMQQPGFEDYSNYIYLFHDTCGNGNKAVADNFKFRANRQRGCFSYPNCSSTTYNDYSTCYNTNTKVKNCNWWFQYYPVMVNAELSTMACSLLGVPGPVDLHNQPNSYVCYGEKLDASGNPDTGYITSDQPFTEGDRCTECPSDATLCIDNALCGTDTTSTTTNAAASSMLYMYDKQNTSTDAAVAADPTSKAPIASVHSRPTLQARH